MMDQALGNKVETGESGPESSGSSPLYFLSSLVRRNKYDAS